MASLLGRFVPLSVRMVGLVEVGLREQRVHHRPAAARRRRCVPGRARSRAGSVHVTAAVATLFILILLVIGRTGLGTVYTTIAATTTTTEDGGEARLGWC